MNAGRQQAPVSVNPYAVQARLQRAGMRYAAIRGYYLKQGNTEQDWQAVSADVRLFNRVWREMLQIPPSDIPPPEAFRR
jgi:hypothetical protein